MEPTLWSDEYFQDLVHRHIKNQIQMMIHVRHDRYPTREEYIQGFRKFFVNSKLDITNADLGNYELPEELWFEIVE